MRTFQEFCNLPAAELAALLRLGLGLAFEDEQLKRDGDYFVQLRTAARKKPNKRYPYGPAGEVAETLHIDKNYQVSRLVYYKEARHVALYAVVCNQVALFQQLRRLGFLE